MSEHLENRDLDQIPEAVAKPKRRFSIQLIWIIPIIAAMIGATLAVKAYLDRGRTITITFKTGEGLEADKTKIKYKEVEIGKVKSMKIAKDRSHVIVTAQLNRDANKFLVEDTRFWVVRPTIHGGKVSGLGTLMGGSYIDMDAGKSGKSQRVFQGLESQPVVSMNEPGSRFVLRAADLGSISLGAPLFFRRLQVGQVVSYELEKNGDGVLLTIFVKSPYDRFVRTNTLFWHASGIDVNVNAGGVKINTESIVSVLVGGIGFQSPDEGDPYPPAAPDTAFTLFVTKEEALKHATVAEQFVLLFKESIRGLSPGAPVEFRGVTLGEVTSISMEFNPRNKTFHIPVEIRLYPDRMRGGMQSSRVKQAGSRAFLKEQVDRGLRAQLKTGNLLTGQLYINLEFFPKAHKVSLHWNGDNLEFPTVPASQEELQATLTRIAKKIEKIPLQELAGDARQALQTLDRTLKSADDVIQRVDAEVLPEAQATLKKAHEAMDAAKQVLSADAPVHRELREALRDIARAAREVGTLAEYLERHPESLLRGKKEDAR